MKKIILLTLVGLMLSACAGAAQEAGPSATDVGLETQIAKAVEGTVAAEVEADSEEKSAPTATDEATATATAEPEATATATEEAAPTETEEPTPTATAVAFDPNEEYGAPTLLDTFASDGNWVDGNGDLPNSDFLRMALGTNQLLVTGKPANFDTWWFTWPGAGDQYLEMKVEVENCDGRQVYGVFVRGPSDASEAEGYIFTFSCDGAYRLRRLDDSNPYTFEDLIPWTESDLLNVGDDEINTMGIRLVGDTITLFANGEELAEVTDDTYAEGRFGLFVNAGPPGDFTYVVHELSFWDLDS